ncbi:MAG: hypothetical protein HY084_07200 [Gemmatimonadetes bacterium]|nr:hypothetical protein [Gemmatimonadota bacterium]
MSGIALGLALVAVTVRPVAAQNEMIGFDKVHELLAGKQTRAAAYAMQEVSVDFRKELGRCHDEAIGGRMMQTEPRIDGLGAKIASGAVSAAALDKEFGEIDHLLAEHHQQLAAEGFSRPRFTKMETVARDVSLAAQYLARSSRWVKQPLASDMQKAVDDALAIAKQLAADPGNPPVETPAVIDALGVAVKRPMRVAQGGSTP